MAILDLARRTPLYQANDQDDPAAAAQARIIAAQAVAIVHQYGPAAVLTATADALTYYLAAVQPHETAGSVNGYEAVTQAIRECRQAADALRLEAVEMLTRS